jgi:hypothetical protein
VAGTGGKGGRERRKSPQNPLSEPLPIKANQGQSRSIKVKKNKKIGEETPNQSF